MIAGAQMEARQQERLSPGKWQAQRWSFSTGMTSMGWFVCFQEGQTLLDTPRPALGKALAGFTAFLVGSDREERSSLGRLRAQTKGPKPVLPTSRWLLWDYHMVRICFEDKKGCMEVSKAHW